MGRCRLCGAEDRLISSYLGLCRNCIINRPNESNEISKHVHQSSRARFLLPGSPPNSEMGLPCGICSNDCRMREGESGFCGIRSNIGGKLQMLSDPKHGVFDYYKDPHPTNCCAAWFCPGGTGSGYPEFSTSSGPEIGFYNLAIFLYGCNFDCLFCQNWQHKFIGDIRPRDGAELIDLTIRDNKITCWCFFGGSPEPQLPFVINVSRAALESRPHSRILRICFEWNGCGNLALTKKAAEIAYDSGGNVKFDLKCWNNSMSLALSGVDNSQAFKAFEIVADEFWEKKKGPPILNATTLLVPGYVGPEEVEPIAKFISRIDDEIPYSLLIFYPQYLMSDLPVTPRSQVEASLSVARKHLKNVNLGNKHLLLWA